LTRLENRTRRLCTPRFVPWKGRENTAQIDLEKAPENSLFQQPKIVVKSKTKKQRKTMRLDASTLINKSLVLAVQNNRIPTAKTSRRTTLENHRRQR